MVTIDELTEATPESLEALNRLPRQPDVSVGGAATRFQRDAGNGAQVSFGFCPRCGTTVYWVTSRKPDKIAVAGGAFGANDWLVPNQSVNENNKLPWVTLDDSPTHQP